jgi:perosamine synthetase
MSNPRKIPFGRPMIDQAEKDAVMKVLDGPILVHGPVSVEFEQQFAEFTGAPYAVSVSSCTAGMHLIYFALGYGPGDEVIVPAQTHIATAHAVALTGATPVFVDADPECGNINIDAVEQAVTPNTRAIAVVHYLGVPVDMPKIMEIAGKHNLFVLEDCALAPGARVDGVHAGLLGDAGVFSFYPVKHLTTGEGGMVILRDGALAENLKLLKAFGVDRTHGERKVPGVYDTVALGFNYRMSEIHAAIGVEQLKKLPGFLEARKQNYTALSGYLSDQAGINILPQPVNDHVTSCHYCMGVLLNDELAPKRPALMEMLGKQGIGTSVYYPQPVPRMRYYQEKYGYEATRYPNAARISDSMLALPVGPHLNTDDMQYMAAEFKKCIKEIQ